MTSEQVHRGLTGRVTPVPRQPLDPSPALAGGAQRISSTRLPAQRDAAARRRSEMEQAAIDIAAGR